MNKNQTGKKLSLCDLEVRLLVVDFDEDVADDQLVLVGAELELGPEAGVAGPSSHRRRPLLLDEIRQLCPGRVVPHDVGVAGVGVE